MKFINIARNRNISQIDLFKNVCENSLIEYVKIDENSCDFSKLEQIQEPHLIYRSSATYKARIIEQSLVNSKSATFYSSLERAHVYIDNVVSASIIHQKNSLSIPKTIFDLNNDREKLRTYAEELSFPLILKKAGGSHGVGVVKIDSMESLFSIADLLHGSGEQFIMREFIKTSRSARLIVLGNQVIDSIEYSAPEGDFRSNEGASPNVKVKNYDQTVQDLAIKATQLLGIEFSGVDIIFDELGKAYLIEVNFPCFFPRAEKLTGTPIAKQMIEHLLAKTK